MENSMRLAVGPRWARHWGMKIINCTWRNVKHLQNGSAVSFDPTRPVRDASSPYGGYFAWTNDTDGLPITIATANPVAQLEQREDVSNTQRHIISGSTDYRFSFLPELRANLNLSYDYSQGDGTVTVDSLAAYDFDIINSGGELRTYDETQKSKLLELNNGNLILVGESWSSDADISENKGFSDALIIKLK